ncbi:MAG: hypothetical protein K2X90_00945 [Candidatus Babeliaceae bacterium]|nr:hypothetical protein [Candidatus Babeliaceae bacterium]
MKQQEIINDNIVVVPLLWHCIKEARSEKTDHKFFKLIQARVIDLIVEAYPEAVSIWVKKKEGHKNKRPAVEEKASRALWKIHDAVKQELSPENLLHKHYIDRYISSMKDALAGYPDVLLTSHVRVAYDYFKRLCYEILKLGKPEIIKNYVKIRHSRNLNELVIDKFFIPEVDALLKYDEILCWDNRKKKNCPPWVAWETLATFKWSMTSKTKYEEKWTTKYREHRDEVRREKLCLCYSQIKVSHSSSRCGSPEACKNGEYRLYLKGLLAESKAIKSKRQGARKVSFFSRDNIGGALEVIFNRVCKMPHVEKVLIKDVSPCSLSIYVEEGTYLRLKVEWGGGVYEVLNMHTLQFKDEPKINATGDFIISLVERPNVTAIVALEKYWFNVDKFLKRCGINKVLQKFFIVKKTSKYASLSSDTKDLSMVSANELQQVLATIKRAKHVEWIL